MYVCICNGYRTTDIERIALTRGLSDPAMIYEELGNGPCCGACLPTAQEVVDEALLVSRTKSFAAE